VQRHSGQKHAGMTALVPVVTHPCLSAYVSAGAWCFNLSKRHRIPAPGYDTSGAGFAGVTKLSVLLRLFPHQQHFFSTLPGKNQYPDLFRFCLHNLRVSARDKIFSDFRASRVEMKCRRVTCDPGKFRIS